MLADQHLAGCADNTVHQDLAVVLDFPVTVSLALGVWHLFGIVDVHPLVIPVDYFVQFFNEAIDEVVVNQALFEHILDTPNFCRHIPNHTGHLVPHSLHQRPEGVEVGHSLVQGCNQFSCLVAEAPEPPREPCVFPGLDVDVDVIGSESPQALTLEILMPLYELPKNSYDLYRVISHNYASM